MVREIVVPLDDEMIVINERVELTTLIVVMRN